MSWSRNKPLLLASSLKKEGVFHIFPKLLTIVCARHLIIYVDKIKYISQTSLSSRININIGESTAIYNFLLWQFLPSVQLENQLDLIVSLWRPKLRALGSEPYALSFLIRHHWVHKYLIYTSFYCQIRLTFCVIREKLKVVHVLIFTSEIHYSSYLDGQSDELWIFYMQFRHISAPICFIYLSLLRSTLFLYYSLF